MTCGAIIEIVDKLKPNRFSEEDKYRWLTQIDGMILRELVETHEGGELPDAFAGYSAEQDAYTELLVRAPYDTLYRYWLEAQIDLGNSETAKYNNSMQLFNSAYLTYTDWYNRTHMPKRRGWYRFT